MDVAALPPLARQHWTVVYPLLRETFLALGSLIFHVSRPDRTVSSVGTASGC